MTIDKDSPPGAWAEEMARMPWRYSQQVKVDEALAAMRRVGLQLEANVLAQELNVLRAELAHLRGLSERG